MIEDCKNALKSETRLVNAELVLCEQLFNAIERAEIGTDIAEDALARCLRIVKKQNVATEAQNY